MTHLHVNKLEDFIDYDDTMVNKEFLLESPTAKVKLVALKKHQQIPPHNAEGDALLYVLEGEIRFNLTPGIECLSCGSSDDACEEHQLKIKKGDQLGRHLVCVFYNTYLHFLLGYEENRLII